MEKIMMVVIDEFLKSPAISKAIMIIMMSLIAYGFRFFYKLVAKNYKSLMQEIKLLNFRIEATDVALEHSLKNGYAEARDKHFAKLKDNDNFMTK